MNFNVKGCLVIEGKAIILKAEEDLIRVGDYFQEITFPNVNLAIKLDVLDNQAAEKLYEILSSLTRNAKIENIFII